MKYRMPFNMVTLKTEGIIMTLQLISDNQIQQDGINQEALEEFQEHRVEIKKPHDPPGNQESNQSLNAILT
tara:strand:- start:190 stop:402 length:213 start_codon:yes stop_codon:yes gene_type:complete